MLCDVKKIVFFIQEVLWWNCGDGYNLLLLLGADWSSPSYTFTLIDALFYLSLNSLNKGQGYN